MTFAMSWVVNVMISVVMGDNENAEALSEWLRTEAPLAPSEEDEHFYQE